MCVMVQNRFEPTPTNWECLCDINVIGLSQDSNISRIPTLRKQVQNIVTHDMAGVFEDAQRVLNDWTRCFYWVSRNNLARRLQPSVGQDAIGRGQERLRR